MQLSNGVRSTPQPDAHYEPGTQVACVRDTEPIVAASGGARNVHAAFAPVVRPTAADFDPLVDEPAAGEAAAALSAEERGELERTLHKLAHFNFTPDEMRRYIDFRQGSMDLLAHTFVCYLSLELEMRKSHYFWRNLAVISSMVAFFTVISAVLGALRGYGWALVVRVGIMLPVLALIWITPRRVWNQWLVTVEILTGALLFTIFVMLVGQVLHFRQHETFPVADAFLAIIIGIEITLYLVLFHSASHLTNARFKMGLHVTELNKLRPVDLQGYKGQNILLLARVLRQYEEDKMKRKQAQGTPATRTLSQVPTPEGPLGLCDASDDVH